MRKLVLCTVLLLTGCQSYIIEDYKEETGTWRMVEADGNKWYCRRNTSRDFYCHRDERKVLLPPTSLSDATLGPYREQ